MNSIASLLPRSQLMPRVKPEHKEERCAQIVAAARTCFARAGFHRTTLQDVFAEAKLSAGCVYNYFRSKEDLVLAIAEERHHDEQQVIAHASSGQDPIEGLRSIAQHFADTYLKEEGRERRHIAIQTWAEAVQNRAILRAVIAGFEEPKTQIAKLIRRGQTLGKLSRTVDAEATARTMIAMFHGFILQKLWEPGFDPAVGFAVFERFLDSLSAESDRRIVGKSRRD
jgi:AcrR family transcriptional regulator